MSLQTEPGESKEHATVRFSERDLELFSDASGDRNPLHMSSSYASETAYGQRVVFGALGALACLGHVHLREGRRTTRITADFHRPMFLDIDYQIKRTEEGESQTVRLFDGSVPLLTLSVGYEQQLEHDDSSLPETLFERTEAASGRVPEIRAGLKISGRYRADSSKLAALRLRWNITAKPFVAETLLWGSYTVGMELPGRSALFFRFDLKFESKPVSATALAYEAEVTGFKPSIAQLHIAVSLSSGGQRVAGGQLLSFIRPQIEKSADFVGTSAGFAGKVAMVIGASRGLGAALTGALAAEGAQVIAVSRSARADYLAAYPPEVAKRIEVEAGDAADREWLAQLRNRLIATHRRLDFLICNAFPAIPALRLELNALSRIEEYLGRAATLVLAPLCAFLDLLEEGGGCAVIVSSMAVEEPVREWPHYVAAKNAIEALARVAPLQYPRTSALIVRPERLLTEMTNTPMGRRNALPAGQMAAQILERLRNPPAAGKTEVLRNASGGMAQEADTTSPDKMRKP